MPKDIKFKFTACNPPGCRCPDVEYDNGLVTILDDYGGTVKLSLNELELIVTKTQNILLNVKADMERQEADTLNQQEAIKRKREELLQKQKDALTKK